MPVVACVAAVAALAGSVGDAMSAAAAGPELVFSEAGARLEDAAMSGSSIAVVWSVLADGLRIARAVTSGAGDGALTAPIDVRIGVDQADPDAAVCGGYAAIAYVKREPGDEAVNLALRPDGDAVAFQSDLVFATPDGASATSIACIDGDRTIIAWKGTVDAMPALVWADTGSLDAYWNPPAPADPVTHAVLWGSAPSAPSAAGSASRGHLATIAGGKVRYLAIDVTGHAPGDTTTAGWRVLGKPVDGQRPRGVVAGGGGDTVVVAWTRCDSVIARVSTDEGTTFGPERVVAAHPCGPGSVTIRSIAVLGGRIAVGYVRRARRGGSERLIRSADRLVTHTEVVLGPVQRLQVTGWLGSAANPSLASVRERAGAGYWLPAGSVIP